MENFDIKLVFSTESSPSFEGSHTTTSCKFGRGKLGTLLFELNGRNNRTANLELKAFPLHATAAFREETREWVDSLEKRGNFIFLNGKQVAVVLEQLGDLKKVKSKDLITRTVHLKALNYLMTPGKGRIVEDSQGIKWEQDNG